MKAYYDSDWAIFPITQWLVSGFFIIFGGSPISWKSKKHTTFLLSFVEAKYRSMRKVCSELVWLSRLFHEFNITNITLIAVKCDNQATIYIATNHVFHEKTKHIE